MRYLLLWIACLIGTVTGAQPPAEPEHEHSSTLNLAGVEATRPPWAPLPLLRGHNEYLPLAESALASSEPLQQQRAYFLLGQVQTREAAAAIRKATASDRATRVQAGVALCNLGAPTAIPTAAVALKEGPESLQLYAIYALWKLDSARARQALQDGRAYLSPFLQEIVTTALASKPRKSPQTRLDLGRPVPDTLAQLWEDVADIFVEESDWWWHKGNYEQCIRCQETSLSLDPGYVDLYGNIAWLQWSMGRHGQAINTYRRGIAANPQSWEAEQALGQYYVMQKRPELALPHLQRAAQLGSPAIPRRQLGHTLEQLGRNTEALQAWQDILKLDPNDPIATRQVQRLQ